MDTDPEANSAVFQTIKSVIVRFSDVAQSDDCFQYLYQAPVSLREAPLVLFLHRGDDFHGLGKCLVAFGQLLQTFVNRHSFMLLQRSGGSAWLQQLAQAPRR